MNLCLDFKQLIVMLAAVVLIWAVPAAAEAGTILSNNLSEPTGGTEAATGDTWLTASFGTDTSAYDLTSVTLLLQRTSIGGTAELDIYSDGGLEPGSLLGTLTSPGSISTSLGETTFTASGITLSSDSTYWLVLKATSGEFDWGWAGDNSGSGVGFQHTWGVSDDEGATWFTYDSYPTQMLVSATAVPEPTSMVLLGLGALAILGYRLQPRQRLDGGFSRHPEPEVNGVE